MHNSFHLAPGLLLCLLPLTALFLAVWLFRLRGEAWRSAILASATSCGLYVALTTELLSAFRQVTRPALAIVWGLFAAVITLGIAYISRGARRNGQPHTDSAVASHDLTTFDYSLLTGITLIVAFVGITALLAPPNTWDVVSYHLPRVAMWQNNRDVGNYPTFYSAQLFLSPWAEYAILHLYVLSGGDYLANLVEWLSMIGLILGVSLVAQRLGAGLRGQIFAAVTCATIPGLILESSGSMNTAVSAFWIVAATYYFLRANEDHAWTSFIAAGATVGLAVLTKGTAYIFFPLLFLACWLMSNTRARKLWLLRLPVLALIFLAINGPLYIRNYELSGSPLGFSTPLGQDPQRQYANSTHSIGITYANIVKNVALHMGTPVRTINERITRFIEGSLSIFGIDPNDTASTYRTGFSIPSTSMHESTAGAPLQCLLIAVTILLLFSEQYGDRKLRLLALALCGSFALFCALIRWQLWNARYQLPLLCLGLCIASVIFERVRPRFILPVVTAIMLLYAIPFVLQNRLRPLAPWKSASVFRRPRVDFYFEEGHQTLEASYKFATAQIESGLCRNVGIDSSLEDFDYPLMSMLKSASSDIKLRYYQVNNVTAKYLRPEARTPPCAVVCFRCARVPAKWAEYRGIGGKASTFDEIAVFSSEGNLDNNQTLALSSEFSPEALLRQLDEARDAIGFDIFASPAARVRTGDASMRIAKASRDWPAKSLDLEHRLEGIETLSLAAWRVRDSVDPMLRRGQPLDYSKADRLQFVAASELLNDWRQTLPEKFEDLNQHIDQLYSTWELRIKSISPLIEGPKEACQATVEKTFSTSTSLSSGSDDRSTILPLRLQDCGCLKGKTAPGIVIAKKPFGSYDSEAASLTACRIN